MRMARWPAILLGLTLLAATPAHATIFFDKGAFLYRSADDGSHAKRLARLTNLGSSVQVTSDGKLAVGFRLHGLHKTTIQVFRIKGMRRLRRASVHGACGAPAFGGIDVRKVECELVSGSTTHTSDIYDFRTGRTTKPTGGSQISGMAINASGTQVAWSNGTSGGAQTFVAPAAGGAARQIGAAGFGIGPFGPGAIAGVNPNDGNVALIPLDGSPPHDLTHPTPIPGQPFGGHQAFSPGFWSANGATIIATYITGTVCDANDNCSIGPNFPVAIDAASGDFHQLAPDGWTQAGVSPDGRFGLVRSPTGSGLYRVPAAGGPMRRIAAGLSSQNITWAP